MVRIKDIMHEITLVSANESVKGVAEVMRNKDIGSVMVKRGDEICGILTERDIICKVVAAGKDPEKTEAQDIMTEKIITISADATILEASEFLNRYKVRRIPAVDKDGKIVGIVSARGVAKALEKIYKTVTPF
ncbi:MAG: CBS domain-containing protein [Candidatus Micrarchaeia archaeon]